MSFSQLPLELVEHVLSYVVGDSWSFPSSASTLPCRLVCKLFDRIVSQHIFRRLDLISIYSGSVSHATAVWLLRTKSTMGVKHYTYILSLVKLNEISIRLWMLYREKDKGAVPQDKYREPLAHVMAGSYALRVANQTGSDLWWDLKYTTKLLPSRSTSPPPLKEYDADEHLQSMTKYGTLSVAAYLGDVLLMQELLRVGADPNEKHEEFGAPLYAAAFAGRTDSLALLLDAGAHATDSQGPRGTPMEVAVQRGHEAAVRLLVDRHVDVGRALWDALVRKRLPMADLLLEHGCVDVNTNRENPDFAYSYKPITLAMKNDYRRLALALARRPELRPNGVHPPLVKAIYKKWDDVAEALLARPDTNAAKLDSRGGTALHAACKTGNLRMVQQLLARDDVAVNKVNMSGRTALGSALLMAQSGSAGLLLDRADCDASLGYGIENMPLVLASQASDVDMVERLLQRPEVREARYFATLAHDALGYAVESADGRMFDLLRSACPSIDLNGKDRDGVPFVHLAVARYGGNGKRLQMLLAAGDVDTNVLRNGATPLVAAVKALNSEAVAILLARADVQVNANGREHTALWNAVGNWDGGVDIVRMLLAHADIDPNLAPQGVLSKVARLAKDLSAATPAHAYVLREDFARQDVCGAPLARAVLTKNYRAMKLLLAHDAIDPNTADSDGRTPLWWAVYGRKLNVPATSADATRLLLAHAATDPNRADKHGWTPLLLAVFLGCGEEVEALLAHSATDRHRPNEDGCTPLEMAERCEHVDIKAQLQARSSAYCSGGASVP